MNLINLAYRVN